MLDAAVTQTVRRYLHGVEESGIPVRFGVVFGSQAEGRVSAASKILVVVHAGRGGIPAGYS